jgi:hypothetical protein
MTAGPFFLVGALSCGASVAMGLVVCGIVLDHRDRAARSLEAPGLAGGELARAVVEPTTALAGVLPQTPTPAGAAIVAAVSAIHAHELDETLPTLPPPLPIPEPRPATNPVVHL